MLENELYGKLQDDDEPNFGFVLQKFEPLKKVKINLPVTKVIKLKLARMLPKFRRYLLL